MKPSQRPGGGLGSVPWEIARRLYRWRRLNVGIGERLKRLQDQLAELPRTGVGIPLSDVDPSLDKRVSSMREADRELVIGDFDQDGGILPRFGELTGAPVIAPEQFTPRTGCKVLLVDLNGRVGVRKEFAGDIKRFVQELEALLHLESRDCPVPRVMNVNWKSPSITETFVPGNVVRELLAQAGAHIRDRDANIPVSRSGYEERVRAGRPYVSKVMSKEQIEAVAAGIEAIHAAGFVLEDVKFGNIILPANSGEPIFVDLERALPIDSLPREFAEYLKQIDLRKFREHFGDVPRTR
jgi:hypothetical protein